MAKAGNVHFIRSTKIKASEILSPNQRSVWSSCDAVFSRIEALCGEGASRLFAEPNVKQQEGEDLLNVAWFGSFDDHSQELEAVDRARYARLQEHLAQRLAALRPALADPEIGETVAAMLNLYDHKSIMAVGEHVVLVNWGALRAEATVSHAAYSKHTDGTIGHFLAGDMTPLLPGKTWTALGTAEAQSHSQTTGIMAAPAPATQKSTAEPAPLAPPRGTLIWPPALLAAVFALLLLYVAWPGNLLYEKEGRVDSTALAQLEASNTALTQKQALYETELNRDACAIDPTIVGLPARETAQTPAPATQGNKP